MNLLTVNNSDDLILKFTRYEENSSNITQIVYRFIVTLMPRNFYRRKINIPSLIFFQGSCVL